jgi:uncharacterized protein HemX
MGFLVAKILFLLVLAAACGAALAYWWFRRRYEDITVEYARWREQLSAWRSGFEERLAARPEVDLQPLWEQVASVDEAVRAIPEPRPTDLTPVLDAIARIRIPERVDLAPVQLRLDNLESQVAGLAAPAPPVDLGPALERLARLEQTVEERLAEFEEVLRSSAAQLLEEIPAEH